jgi:UDP-GlcNAc:undecaprenyl-phosphate/decaprenyl-phosphate GlcNAc-1-phosphate transferase
VSGKLTIIFVYFVTALVLALLTTPLAGSLGTKLGAFDHPNERKIHRKPIPRVGGIAIFLSFFTTLFLTHLLYGPYETALNLDIKVGMFLTGGIIVFGIGLCDDFHRIKPRVKFAFQVLGASIAYLGGIHITNLFGLDLRLPYGPPVSYVVTVFWFVLFINAINLIDGLDGLAAGIAFFSSTVMTVISTWSGQYLNGLVFGTLAGACLGFLRYNFNPASIFMGDGGSYFLGYIIAGMSIVNSSKTQIGATILIPLLALGVPIFDTILAPIRRFVVGKGMFRPDSGHIHHRLVAMGFSTKKAVWIIYVASMGLCVMSLLLVNRHNQEIGIFLVFLALVAFLFLKRLGYLEHVAANKICDWFRDVSDEAGLSHDRRSFLNLQLEINNSKDLQELWHNTCQALTVLDFDMSKIVISNHGNGGNGKSGHPAMVADQETNGNGRHRNVPANGDKANGHLELLWTHNGFDLSKDGCQECLLKLELPLLNDRNDNLGILWLIKDLKRNSFSHYTLRRVEHLRRSVTRTLERLENEKSRE